MEAADILFKMAKLNGLEVANQLTASEIDTGFGTTFILTEAIQESQSIAGLWIRKECWIMLVTIVSKMQEKSPVKYNFTR